MDSIYIYSGHSSIGNPEIVKSKSVNIDQYLYTTLPAGYQIITLCQFGQSTTTKTTEFLFRALKQSHNIKAILQQLFTYSNQNEKNVNIEIFSKYLVSNFLVNSIGHVEKTKQNFIQSLKLIISNELISKIWESYQKQVLNGKKQNAWTGSHLTTLFSFDFITKDIIDLILSEIKITINIYIEGDQMNWMNFDDLNVFQCASQLTIYRSGIFNLFDWVQFNSQIWKTIITPFNKNMLGDQEKIQLARDSRSSINVDNKIPRHYSLNTIFSTLFCGTYIIPSCGILHETIVDLIQ
jgi:hypothetical protein